MFSSASWRTTLSSILGIIGMLAMAGKAQFDGDAATDPQWAIVLPAIIGLVSGLFARDHRTSDQAAGVRPEIAK